VSFLRRAVACFLHQTYSPRELVVVHDADDPATRDFLATRDDQLSIRALEVPVTPRLSLGALRNRAIASSQGFYVAQWDDDDWYAPNRLASQIHTLQQSGKAGCVLWRWILFDTLTQRAFLSGGRSWEGSLVARRDAVPPYPEIGRGEDTLVIEQMAREDRLVLLDGPDLYIYVYHGKNTWDRRHWDLIAAGAQPLSPESNRQVMVALGIDPASAADRPVSPGISSKPRYYLAQVLGQRMLIHNPEVDIHISRCLGNAGVWEPFETELILNEVRPGDVVLDIGANIGYYTLLLARQVGPQGQVLAFEPDPTNFALLQQNVAMNGYRNVVLSQQAVANRSGPARLYLSVSNLGDHRLYPSAGGQPFVDVQTVALDQYLARYTGPVHLIKMDIQGAECAALEGMTALLHRQNQIKLFTEFWPAGLHRSGSEPARYLQALAELGFRLYEILDADLVLRRTDPQRLLADYLPLPYPEERHTNLLCIKTRTSGSQG